jgi:vacuolar protein sorting-associated protein 45
MPDTPPVLLILDRRSDLTTPLLLQWTYQAMLHDLFGLRNARIKDLGIQEHSVKTTSDNSDNQDKETVFTNDAFFEDNRYANYGQLGENIQRLTKQFETKSRSLDSQVTELPGMRRFLEDAPDYQHLRALTRKHVDLGGLLHGRVQQGGLLDLSEAQQTLAVQKKATERLGEYLQSASWNLEDKLNLCLIYALSNVASLDFLHLKELMLRHHLTDDDTGLAQFVLKVALSDASPKPAPMISQKTVDLLQYSRESVYTQHVPPVVAIVDALLKGRLSATMFPFVYTSQANLVNEKPQDVIVFVVNGSALGEEFALHRLCAAIPAVSIVLGGTGVHGRASLIRELRRLHANKL